MGRIRKSAEDRKREIVETAIRLAGELGPDRVTTQRLADEVGLTQPAIFRHFPTKADIWAAVGREIVSVLDMNRAAATGLRPADQLRMLVTRQLGFVARTPAITAILMSRELHAENEALRKHFSKVMADRRAVFASLIAQEQKAGYFRDTVVPEDAAAVILATIQGLAMRWSLEQRRFNLKKDGERLVFGLLDSWKA